MIESFNINDKHILCVASVPGAVADDYREYEERMAGVHDDDGKRYSVSIF